MLIYYFKIAIRNLAKQKGFSIINILGLSVGLASFSLFLLYTVNEFSFDRFHKNADNIYRVNIWAEGFPGRKPGGIAELSIPFGPALKENFPDVKSYVRLRKQFDEKFLRLGSQTFRMPVTFADPQFFNVFSFKLFSGNPFTALQGPNSIVLTRNRAMQLFGKADILGKTVEIKVEDKFELFIVKGVTENIPVNSTIQFDILLSFSYYLSTKEGMMSAENWHASGFQTYVQLDDGSKLPNEKVKLENFYSKYNFDDVQNLKKEGLWDGKSKFPISIRLQPLRDIHTNIKIDAGPPWPVNPENIWILIGIAGSLLLIACINFTTMAIGRSAARTKEVGIRKVSGGSRRQLIYQFFTESFVLSVFSAFCGLVLAELMMPYFNELSGRELNFSFSQYPEIIWLFALLIICVSLLSGSYPAFILSGLKPIEVLKNKLRLGGANIFTKSLVTFQFILSIGLIMSTLVILKQLSFMLSKNLGFNKESIIVIDAEGTNTQKIYPLFQQMLQSHKEIAGTAGSNMTIGDGAGFMGSSFNFKGKDIGTYIYFADDSYIKVMGMKLIAGRNFDEQNSPDIENSVIINQAMVTAIGLKMNDAIGQQLTETGGGTNLPRVIICVVKDFNFVPLNQTVPPQLFRYPTDFTPSKFFVRIMPGNPETAINTLKDTWSKIAPDFPFKYSFLDEDVDHFYKSEKKWGSIVGWAGGISIFLACLGLFGLTALSAVNRTKEIGIRKILGANMQGIVMLLSKDFVKLILVAFIIATPLAWYIMNNWLQDFAYRTSISWWIFAVSGISVLIIAMFTISYQAVKAALANPVKSLKYE